MYWRSKYWDNKNMSGFLCGMLGNIRKKREKVENAAILNVSNKTNTDVSQLVQEYLRGGVNFIK